MYISIWFIFYTIAACKNTSLEHTADVTFKAYGRVLNDYSKMPQKLSKAQWFSSMKWSLTRLAQ